MTLVLDVGNTSLKYARFLDGKRKEAGRIPLADLAAGLEPLGGEEDVCAVSVNPPVLARLREAFPRLRVMGEDFPLPLPVRYDPPEALGADRVAGTFGALFRGRAPAAVGRADSAADAVLLLDCGTCLTATVGSQRDGVIGGAIAPGPDLMARSLAEGTANLPAVRLDLSEDAGALEVEIGGSTEASIRAGVLAAWLGGARELVHRFQRSFGPLRVVAAGTGGGRLAAELDEVDAYCPFATLWGVYLAAY